jgi:uncharacterized protein YgiM (DUF1202 family)
MHKRRVFLFVVALCCGALAVWAAGVKILSVQYKVSTVRSSPSALGTIVATLEYGERVTVVEDKGAWIKVTTKDGKTGWVNKQALTEKTVKINAGGAAETGASSDEMAMAGKGFSADVEKQFKAQHSDIDFSWVDKIEKWKVAPEQMQEFLKDGKVAPAEGGAK